MGIDRGLGYQNFEHGRHHPSQDSSIPTPAGENWDMDEPLEEELEALASKYLFLDYEPSPSTDDMASVDTGSSSTPTDVASPVSITEDVEMAWGTQSQSASQPLNFTEYGIEIDPIREATGDLWPWAYFASRSDRDPREFDEDDYPPEAGPYPGIPGRSAGGSFHDVRETKSKRRSGEKKGEEARENSSPPIIAFSQVISGRTIYNP